MLGADVKNEKIAVAGWLETTNIWIYDFIQKYIEHGVKQYILYGCQQRWKTGRPITGLYKKIIAQFPEIAFHCKWRCKSMQDLEDLKDIGCKGVIVGKAIYEGRIRLEDLKL